ncbi:MAG: DNA repair protein RecO C-terminal domain-containing protein [Treponema sp.]|nr:DNA repair protein RecO C-terminal domain-containing protein [Treponema sp.]
MTRNACYSALILRSRPSGEANRDIWLLAAEAGLIRATVFGGPKSKLRAYASPFHSGQAWIYQDPSKDSRKLSDFDVKSWRPGLRELYERVMAADAAAETVLATHGGGGNWGGALSLAEAALDALAIADSETCARILLWFLWQWAGFLGLWPEFSRCSSCEKPIPANSLAMFSPVEGGVVCEDCLGDMYKTGLVAAGPGCRRWLETARGLSPVQLNRYTLDKQSFHEAKSLATAILAEALGRRLNSWDF